MPDTASRTIRAIGQVIYLPHRHFASITPDSALVADLHADSLTFMSIACELDEEFGIDLPDCAIARWETVADVIASVREQIDGRIAA